MLNFIVVNFVLKCASKEGRFVSHLFWQNQFLIIYTFWPSISIPKMCEKYELLQPWLVMGMEGVWVMEMEMKGQAGVSTSL